MNQNNNQPKIFSLSLFVAISMFCYCYLNIVAPQNQTHIEIHVEDQTIKMDQEDNEIFFPDLHLFNKAIKVVERILEVM